ncbi:hypothetical protein [Pleionea sediminis]|uniref:hypothetical protein n=1 Tax=Pleionea sediminis TaxID=2569479 RepID=UPI0011856850|nr:hypothetical protein [Pleionea sediminis]
MKKLSIASVLAASIVVAGCSDSNNNNGSTDPWSKIAGSWESSISIEGMTFTLYAYISEGLIKSYSFESFENCYEYDEAELTHISGKEYSIGVEYEYLDYLDLAEDSNMPVTLQEEDFPLIGQDRYDFTKENKKLNVVWHSTLINDTTYDLAVENEIVSNFTKSSVKEQDLVPLCDSIASKKVKLK